jgi:uncharacterized protein (TIGR02145 family)
MKHTLKNHANLLTISIMVAAMALAFLACEEKQKDGSLTYEGQTYKTVKIGEQTWMAENLNVKTNNSWCYGNNESNCQKYGRLYDWNAAKEACPKGWHLPSQEEWDSLISYAGENIAAKKLKSTSGWEDNGNGTDDYGFSALPGGYRTSSGFITYDGFGKSYGLWWSATQYGSTDAYNRSISYSDDKVHKNNPDKSEGYSIRCVQGQATAEKASKPVEKGSLTYEGQTYKTVKIGEQTWMAENLNYNAKGSKCYDDKLENCNKYGRLYNWATAMVLSESCNSSECASQIQPHHRGVCPSGWHIPSEAEWNQLYRYVDGDKGTESHYSSYVAGEYLKAQGGWKRDGDGSSGNGVDTYGFAAIPDGSGEYGGDRVSWWSTDEEYSKVDYSEPTDRGDNDARIRFISVSKLAYASFSDKSSLLNVRCVKGEAGAEAKAGQPKTEEASEALPKTKADCPEKKIGSSITVEAVFLSVACEAVCEATFLLSDGKHLNLNLRGSGVSSEGGETLWANGVEIKEGDKVSATYQKTQVYYEHIESGVCDQDDILQSLTILPK